ncbi:hypothetical protein [Streptomyces sp. NPDC046887]|uniref:hypothetical protein n=1 Tax=Streptomyces sp. NPDC046887 TaxID=3155472 RepID=UPI003401B34D
MTAEPTRWHEPPVELSEQALPTPRPVAGCPECERLAALRRKAADRQDHSTVVDCNVLMRMHPTGHR